MKKTFRMLLAAGTLAAPFAIAVSVEPASATCRPERPETCEMYCPSGNYIYAAGKRICVPVEDHIDIQVPQLP